MSVLVGDETRLVVQGITGSEGKFHAERMQEYGTNVVAGVTPGKGGEEVLGVPVYDTVKEAVEEENANTSVVFVPPAFAGDAVMESLDSDLDLCVAITEGIPTHDMIRVNRRLSEVETNLVGPNCPGVITPGEAKVGIMPGNIFDSGKVGLVSRSGTLTAGAVLDRAALSA
jgi:succinyl-CoA synthetase alpha subunit